MSRIVFASLFLAFVAVTGNAKSVRVPPVTAEVLPVYNGGLFGGGTITLTMKYSRIGSTEAQTNYISFPMEDGRTLDVKFGVRHESDEETAPLQIKFYTKSSDDQDYSVDVSGALNILKVQGGTPYTKRFQQTFETTNPDSEFHSLLGRNILIDPAQGYYDETNDQLTVQVPWQF